MEHKEACRSSPMVQDNRFTRTAEEYKREKAAAVLPPSANYHLYSKRRPIDKPPKKVERSERSERSEKVTTSPQDIRHTTKSLTKTPPPSDFDTLFPSLPTSPHAKTPKVLPDTQDRVIIKELPLPEPVAVALRADGTRRNIYSLSDPDYVPTRQTVTIIEKAKSACWSQRLKESLTVAEPDASTTPIDALTEDEDGFPLVRSTLEHLGL